ncbi:MAG TPA: VCBS repeat-containing protein, partial [Cyclobacteriaceae bacterium]|nr:VCBS repeat-containing protein [Cyclobacteriaceae bacterium]
SVHQNGTFGKSSLRKVTHPLSGDRLLKNENGRFIDVTPTSGIYSSALGYGLGIVVSDVNLDGWPDIYIGNDFHENDYLYINQKDGTFKEMLEECMTHTSRYTMGIDFADINNDAFPDLISADMLPEDPVILKASGAEDAYDVYNFKIGYGYNHQLARNTLQFNNQNGTFSEIALLAGVASTDWSWSALLADFDLDGRKDIYISNGIYRRSNDLDYINFISTDTIQMKMEYDMSEKELAYTKKMPQIKLPNYLFINKGDSTFTNEALAWGMDLPSYSNGTAYADLDNDGDLDLVVNNVEDEAFLYKNNVINKNQSNLSNHFLQISLKGPASNYYGIGAKVFLYDSGKVQTQECMPTRGFQSSVDYRLTFGTGPEQEIDSLLVVWPDDTFEKIKQVKTNQHLELDYQNANGKFNYDSFHTSHPIFINVSDRYQLPYKHRENKFVEFNREGLIPHMMSSEGPACAVGDINGDGLEDIFAGGAKWQTGKIFLQNKDGHFIERIQPALHSDSTAEDVSAVFFDADGDEDNDLFVVSGGNEFSGDSRNRLSRLYLNDGAGNFSRSNGVPDIFITGACASISDIDNDGDQDIFLGARTTPWRYGVRPDSYILLNDGKGNFSDATGDVAPALKQFGFVKQSDWADMDGDGIEDLVIMAEWKPITIFQNKGGKLSLMPIEGSGLDHTNGWWNVVVPVDIDGDGDLDLVAGNLGLNSRLKASVEEPIRLYVKDFDHNDSTDQVLTHYIHHVEYPFYTRDEMTKQMPYLKKRYLSYRKFAEADFKTMFPADQLTESERYEADLLETVIAENLGGGKFKVTPLPKAAQFSTVNAILADDFDKDNKVDLLLAGNFYPINIQMGRNDESCGLFLKNNGWGKFIAKPSVESGLFVAGETRNLKKIMIGDKAHYLAFRNNDTIEFFTLKE